MSEKLNDNQLHKEHRKRVREQFLKEGFSDNTPVHKILELLLFYVVPRKDTNGLAHQLLNKFGSLAGVLDAPEEELLRFPGITENALCLFHLIMPVARIYINDKKVGQKSVSGRREAAELLAKKFVGLDKETVYLLCLDNKGRILDCSRLSEGSELHVSVSSRMVIEQIIKTKATAVMLGHNHPKGFAFPSPADIRVTAQLATAVSHIGVSFLDHIVVADGDFVSMADSKEYSYIFER